MVIIAADVVRLKRDIWFCKLDQDRIVTAEKY